MIKFLFEDKETTPSSQLLKSSFNGENIEFARGNLEISRKVKHILKQNKQDDFRLIVFLDISPNNPATVGLFESLYNQKTKNGKKLL